MIGPGKKRKKDKPINTDPVKPMARGHDAKAFDLHKSRFVADTGCCAVFPLPKGHFLVRLPRVRKGSIFGDGVV